MNYKDFIESLSSDSAFRDELKAFLESKKPENEEAKVNATVEFAAAKGYTVCVEELSAAKAAARELDDEELDAVSGGSILDDICLPNDSCAKIWHYYKKHEECSSLYDAAASCTFDDWCGFIWNSY